jgi:hypothetical protein
MSRLRAARSMPAIVLLLVLVACAEPSGTTSAPSVAELPADDDALVLQVAFTGGFVTPETLAARLPVASVYADGRALVEGPIAEIYPGPAWPNVQVLELGPERVQQLADRALAAGVADTADLGRPPVADVPSTRFTLRTAAGTHVREVYALATETPDGGLTAQQEAARRELRNLFDELAGLAAGAAGDAAPRPWTPDAVAAVVRPWTASDEDIAAGLAPQPVPWPGPALPGDPLGALPGLTCVTATGEEATAVVAAARTANTLTPWSAADGTLWSVTFRPLLPHESGCGDLTG